MKFKVIIKQIAQSLFFDLLLLPFTFFAGIALLLVRKIGIGKLNLNRAVLLKIGIIPVRDHYYEPLFMKSQLSNPLNSNRNLPGINWNISGQLSLLNQFNYSSEFENMPNQYKDDLTYNFSNDSFESGDAEFWYSMIRIKKPKTIIEIGSGHSTKMAQAAIKKNTSIDDKYHCEHICIEPYEMPWLEKLGITIIREKVENTDKGIFNKLGENDILFIDSSHVIRPQGDVLFEYLELLPILNKGVIVHIHDIFSPNDYLKEWIFNDIYLWDEQYLLEAFLTENENWEIIGAVNLLKHHNYELLKSKCPRLTNDREPGSFYIRRVL